MKPLSVMLLVCVTLCACSQSMRQIKQPNAQEAYEYVYRLFYARDLPPKEEITSENMTKYFFPLGSLNRAMDQFTTEGFSLDRIEKMGNENMYVFYFKRPKGYVEKKERITLPPQLYGVYYLNTGGKIPKVVVLTPAENGGLNVVQFSGIIQQNRGVIDGENIHFNTKNSTVTLTLTEGGKNIKFSRQFFTEDKPNLIEYMGVKIAE